MTPLRVVIITGLSGAGKSQAIRALEDLDFFCVDNLPPAMLQQFILLLRNEAAEGQQIRRVALCIDVRSGAFFENLQAEMEPLAAAGITPELLYLEASDEALLRRFKETRRPHPLAPQGRVQEGIRLERERLDPLKRLATHIVDTSKISPHQLKARLREWYAPADANGNMLVSVLSFGFKYGIPEEADLVFDVRFLPNPHWIPELRPMSGRDQEVYDYVMAQQPTEVFLGMLEPMLDYLLPFYAKEGKSQLVIGIGCTGGRHRSVAVAIRIAEHLQNHCPHFLLEHRDLELSEEEESRN